MADQKLEFILSAKNYATKEFQNINKQTENLRKNLKLAAVAGGLFAVAIGTKAIKEAIKFEKAMREVNTLLNKNEEDFKSLGDEILKLSTEVPDDGTVLSAGLYQVVSAGITDTSEAMKVLEVSSRAAVGGVSDTKIAADAITTVLNSYGLAASEAGHISDLLFATVKQGKTTFSELAPAIGNVVSTASAANINFETISASLSTMTRSGISTDESVTALNQTILSLLKPSEQMAAVFQKAGFASGEAALNALGFQETLKLLAEETNGSTAEMAELFPNVRALKGVLTLTGAQAEGFSNDLKLMANSTGIADAAFEEMIKSTDNQYKILKNFLNVELIKLGNEILPKINSVIKSYTNELKKLEKQTDKSSQSNKQFNNLLTVVFENFGRGIARAQVHIKGFLVAWVTVINTAITKAIEWYNLTVKAFNDFDKWLYSFVYNKIPEKFEALTDSAYQWGANLLTEFGNGVSDMAYYPIQAVQDMSNSIADYIGFSSPSKKGAGKNADKWAPNLMFMFADGIERNGQDVINALSDVMEDMSDVIKDYSDDNQSIQQNYISSIQRHKDNIRELTDEYVNNKNEISNNIDIIKGKINELDNQQLNVSAQFGGGVVEAIVKQKQVIQDLKNQTEGKEGDELALIQERLQKEQEAFNSYGEFRSQFADQIAELEDFKSKTDFEQKIILLQKEKEEKEKQLEEQRAILQIEKEDQENQYNELQARFAIHIQELQNQRLKDVDNYKSYLKLRENAFERHLSRLRDMEGLTGELNQSGIVNTNDSGGSINTNTISVPINLGNVNINNQSDLNSFKSEITGAVSEALRQSNLGIPQS